MLRLRIWVPECEVKDCFTQQGAEIVPPKLDDVYVERRGADILALNVLGPYWAVTGQLGYLILSFSDGARSLSEIYDLLGPLDPDLRCDEVIESYRRLEAAGLYRQGRRGQIAPLSNVILNITRICNLSCPFCYYDSGPHLRERGAERLSLGQWLNLIDEIAAINPKSQIVLMGGEPFARKDSLDLIEGIAARGLAVAVISNGMLLGGKRVERLAQLERLRLQISIDSLTPEIDAAGRGPTHLKKALANINRLIAAGVEVSVSMTLTRANAGSFPALRAYCDARGIYLRTSTFFTVGERSQEAAGDLGLTNDEVLAIHAGHMVDLPEYRDAQLARHLRPGQPKFGCGLGSGTIAVHPEGTVTPCNHVSGTNWHLGNVTRQPLAEIVARGVQSCGFADVARMPRDGCGGCPVRLICGGGCVGDSLGAYGHADRPPPNCSALKRLILDAIWADLVGFDASPIPERAAKRPPFVSTGGEHHV